MACIRITQRLSQINNVVVVPSQSQVTVHPQTGRKEYIFVDLEAVYPSPDEPGSELSFEEIMAAHRGWLDQSWADETMEDGPDAEPVRGFGEVDEVSHGVKSVLTIHRDPVLLDENGSRKEQAQPRATKSKKTMELNETQISKFGEPLPPAQAATTAGY